MEIRLPNLGEDIEAGTVLSIFVKEGDTVEADQALIELESEKAVASVPAPVAGRVTGIHVHEGDEIREGAPIVSLEPSAGAPAKPEQAPDREEADRASGAEVSPKPVSTPKAPAPSPEPTSEAPRAASPSIRRMARQLGIDLGRVRATGRGGRIVLGDLRDYIGGLQRSASSEPAGAVEPQEPSYDFSRWGPVTPQRMSSLRKTIARRMAESWTRAPHVTQFGDADITELEKLRRAYVPLYKERDARLTLTPILLKATARALSRHPVLNSSLDEAAGTIVTKSYYHLGLAVDTDAGLIVPVIREVDRKTVFELAREIEELTERTRRRQVSKEEMQGGTFTLSNQGGIGGRHFTPIINLPEVAILGVGRSREVAVFVDQAPLARLMLPLAVSHDHRVVDGADGVRFLVDLIQTVETFPESELKLD